jgi:hypothetical protein
MPLPTPADDETRKLVAVVYLLLQRLRRWPTFAELDWEFDRLTRLEAEEVLRGAPPGLFYGFGPTGAPPHDSQIIALTLAGLNACPDADEDVAAFLATIRYATELHDGSLANDLDLEISSASIGNALALPAAGRADLVVRLGRILEVEPWGWESSQSDERDGWRFTIDRRIRRLRDITTAADYWDRVHENQAGQQVGTAQPEANPDQASRVRAWIELFAQPPRLVIVNASEAEVRNVVPTPALLGRDDSGEVVAFIGGGPLGRLAELSPGGAAVMDLAHFADWAGDPRVESELHVDFDDARGQRWQVGHGRIVVLTSATGSGAPIGPVRLVAARDLDLSQPAGALATAKQDRVAFISYVHDDKDEVDRLQRELEDDGIVVWRDLDQLFPGDNIKDVIARTIRDRSFAFISCFSRRRANRSSTVANRELATAIDVLQDHATSSWFIPVAFDDSPLPDLMLGPIHGHINDIFRAKLYGDARSSALEKLKAALHRVT